MSARAIGKFGSTSGRSPIGSSRAISNPSDAIYPRVPMSLVTWSFPTTLVFGTGSIAKIPDHVKRVQGTRALIVCDAGVVKAGIAEKVRKVLESGGVPTMIFDRVDPNPIEKNIEEGVAAYKS